MRTKSTWLQAVVAVAVIAGGAVVGSSLGARRAEATPAPAAFHWKCIWIDECGAGTKECCFYSGSGTGHTHCSTNCPIEIE